MRTHDIWAGAKLALGLAIALALAACGASPNTAGSSPGVTCVNPGAPHHAYVVVQHLSGSTVQRCVGFTGAGIDAASLMDQSRVEYQTQTFSFGKAVCQIDREPAQYTKCFADTGPNWTLFVETSGAWAVAQTGYTQVTLHDKDALGWEYTSSQSPPPPPLPKEL